jgi:undecaprenyl phosphate-alpha-L-ara4N flippase subunit ArnE
MLKTIMLSTLQCLLLCSGQVFLKIAMNRMGDFRPTWKFILSQAGNWALLASGISMVAATCLWMYIIKHYEFSVAYPMTSMSYLFGLIAAVYIFNETVPLSRWAGVILVIAGVLLITKQA